MEKVHPSQRDYQNAARRILDENPEMCNKIVAATGLESSLAGSMLTEVLKFLSLVSWSGRILTPPHILDLAWHEFILFTRTYDAFCHSWFGRFIHHQPGGEKHDNRQQLRTALKLYHLCFDQAPDPRFWGEHDMLSEEIGCGGCR